MSRRAALCFALTAFCFGTSFVGIEAGLVSLPPVLFAAFRVDVAAVVLLAYAWYRYDAWRPRSRADVLGVVASGLLVVVANNVLLFVGQTTTSGNAGAVVYGLMPVVAPAFAVFLLRDERVSLADAAGLLLGLTGVVVIVQPDPANLVGSAGQGLVACAAVCVALGSVLLRRISPTMPTLALTGWSMALAAPVVHGVSLGLNESAPVAWTPDVLGAVLYVGLVGTAVAYPAYYALIGAVGPVRANLTAYAMPVVAALTGWAVLGETVAPETGVGFVVVFAGFAVVQRRALVEGLRDWLGRDVEVSAFEGSFEAVDD
ncbi:EamA family transporter [Salinigranum rubrum]|uniref:EamA family transporter n=1 Tax=Salinigranum rubrum TaxID=755307 RepID=A0A2I8VN29_9EURY|nr:DMT family transporter [Salinigranum rubrum]AUV83328.1 EamA family transporter [Salinigranum rubrum]